MWRQYWHLNADPFAESSAVFVATTMHREAVARLVHVIEAGHALGVLEAPAGLGKSRVLAEAVAMTQTPSRRFVLVSSPTDGTSLVAELAERLGARVPEGCTRALAWRRLADAVRLCHWQAADVVLAIDDCHHLVTEADRMDLDRLVHVAPRPRSDGRVTVVRVGREPRAGGSAASEWSLPVRLAPLTRGDAEHYLVAKLSTAGRDRPTFTPRALTRLHALAGGVPRALDQLASLALIAGASRGVGIVPPELIEMLSLECAPAADAG